MNKFDLQLKSIRMRLVETSDAEFILQLRLNENLNTYLSPVSPNIQQQIEWLESYKKEEAVGKQFYFIIERADGIRCGTVRIYDLKGNSFSWGSWILNENKTRLAAIESALLVYKFGFNALECNQSHFEVMKGNQSVSRFHERMGAERVSEDETFYYYTISKSAVESQRAKLESMLS
ncbi:GNAT family N-acetyltransferase [Roseateles sp. DXS20W]|uniref:GNAT family N-acetyltransferase n=1 Tax=Pelomonas lactea TaxID=3299030 RepID=A0ABW7GI79_9BURK